MTAKHKARHSLLSLYSFIYLFFCSFQNQFNDFCSAYVDCGLSLCVCTLSNALTTQPFIHPSIHQRSATLQNTIFSIKIIFLHLKRENIFGRMQTECWFSLRNHFLRVFVRLMLGCHRFSCLFTEWYTPAWPEVCFVVFPFFSFYSIV